jgi:heme exporter protein A
MRLEVTDLSCDRAGQPVLRGVSFALAGGAVLPLRGPNGAGKSTLLRVLAGLLPPAGGSVALDGDELARDADRYAERVAYVGHLDAVKPTLTVAENLEFWAGLFAAAGIGLALRAFDLEAIADRPAGLCSAGQKRRLGLARLVLADRLLWLLDEPTVSLDAAAEGRLIAAIREHCSGGGMAVIATHAALDLSGVALTLQPLDRRAAAAGADPFLVGTLP